MSQAVERIIHNNELLALIIRSDLATQGIEFYTPNEFSQQIASMGHAKGKKISPHMHNKVPREVTYTNEVLIIKQGKLRVDFYDNSLIYLESRILSKGDIILLAKGGHGFEVIEDVQMVEVKQGPYAGEVDRTQFLAVSSDKLIIK